MKRAINISYFSHAFMMLAFMGAVSACVQDDNVADNVVKTKTDKEVLAVSPTVSESALQLATTRAESIDTLQEKKMNTLDVFVEHVTGTTGDGDFLKQYHLNANITEGLNWLADSWRGEGLLDGEKYNIYVAANNPLTVNDIVADDNKDAVTKLKELTFNEVTEGIATVKDGNIDWKDGDTSGNIYKRYSTSITGRAYTNAKEFMMDGVIKNWTPTPNSKTQQFDVTMKRAAAKIVLNVSFDANFLKSLTQTKKIVDGVETWVDKPAEEKVTITGTPAWRFTNFAFGAPVFTPDTTPAPGVEVHNSGFNIFHNQSVAGGAPFTITTYSYPNKWTETTSAPSLVLSIGYTQNGETSYNYYRVPVVPKDTTSLNRNTIYVIDAIIATRGSDTHEDITEMENLYYEVVNWNDKNNNDAIHNEVESVQHQYLKVNPKVYTLHGDDNQSLIINYQKATGTEVGYKVFAINTTTEEKGAAVEPTASNAVWAWYYDKNGKMKTTYSNWSHLKVTFTQSNEGINGSSGTVTVNSTALDNRAIKYILLRVYLKENPNLYEDVLIRHFPTDNIQSITGAWSTYHADGSTETRNNWVDWDRDHGKSGTAKTVSTDTGGGFNAHVYYNNQVYNIASSNNNMAYRGNASGQGSNINNHMYVIQISSTSNKYVLGKPVVGTNNQSQDQVVAPAFMIASQLGVVGPGWTATQAATHCSRYMEIGTDGTRYGGWRLPTAQEIAVISDYQNGKFGNITIPQADRVMDGVLKGQTYFNLSGGQTASQWPNASGGPYLRCIRELSAAEIEKLNGFDALIEKYQAR